MMKCSLCLSNSISRLIRHQALPCYWPPAQALPTSTATPGEGAGLVAMTEELDERMEAIIEANDVLLERVVGVCPSNQDISLIRTPHTSMRCPD